MPVKRSTSAAGEGASPLWNAAVVGAAVAFAAWSVFARRGGSAWAWRELLTTITTVAGCLAIAGPFVLFRRGGDEQGVGDLAWMTSGLLILIFDLAAVVQGAPRSHNWVNPIEIRSMGLIVLAVLLAGRHQRGAEPLWTWTNVLGWLQSATWLAAAAISYSSALKPTVFSL